MTDGPRLRQVALVARDGGAVGRQLRRAFGWADPFVDPGVGAFGLSNEVFAAGDTFVEVVTPVRPDTTAGRYLDRRSGDGGYMAIFQIPDMDAARRRIGDLGVRVVWSADHADIAGTHLHPKDVPGAIVSLDWADPPDSWRWAGPAWTGGAPEHAAGGITGLTVGVGDPPAVARRWADVLGVGLSADGTTILLESAAQVLRFVPERSPRSRGIVGLDIAGLDIAGLEAGGLEAGGLEAGGLEAGGLGIGGVRFAAAEG